MDKRATDVALRPRLGMPLVDGRRRVPSLVPSEEPCAQFHAPRPCSLASPSRPPRSVTDAIMHRHCSCAVGLARSRSPGSLSREWVDTASARTCVEQRMTRVVSLGGALRFLLSTALRRGVRLIRRPEVRILRGASLGSSVEASAFCFDHSARTTDKTGSRLPSGKSDGPRLCATSGNVRPPPTGTSGLRQRVRSRGLTSHAAP